MVAINGKIYVFYAESLGFEFPKIVKIFQEIEYRGERAVYDSYGELQ